MKFDISNKNLELIGIVIIVGFMSFLFYGLINVDKIVAHSDGSITIENSTMIFGVLLITLTCPVILLIERRINHKNEYERQSQTGVE